MCPVQISLICNLLAQLPDFVKNETGFIAQARAIMESRSFFLDAEA
jgi:hypothetical protein